MNVDEEVLKAIESEGYRLDPTDPLERRFIDKHGRNAPCVLMELELMGETPEGVCDHIRSLHLHSS